MEIEVPEALADLLIQNAAQMGMTEEKLVEQALRKKLKGAESG